MKKINSSKKRYLDIMREELDQIKEILSDQILSDFESFGNDEETTEEIIDDELLQNFIEDDHDYEEEEDIGLSILIDALSEDIRTQLNPTI